MIWVFLILWVLIVSTLTAALLAYDVWMDKHQFIEKLCLVIVLLLMCPFTLVGYGIYKLMTIDRW